MSDELGPDQKWTSAIVDGHVHLHSSFDVSAFLTAAERNLAAHCKSASRGGSRGHSSVNALGVIAFTDMSGQDSLERLSTGCCAGWICSATGEAESLVLSRRDACNPQSLLIVAGRQVVTAEKIEVLALGTQSHIADGQPVDETIAQAHSVGALPVLTWGFGKWLGPTAPIIARLARDTQRHPLLFFADSSVRMAHTPLPAGLKAAKTAGRIVLAGTDPLPIAQEEAKVGRLAFKADVSLSANRPWSQLRDYLVSLKASPEILGRFEDPLTFARHQFTMQMRKRSRAVALTHS